MPSSKLADRMAAFEANIRENEKHGFDSTPLAFARRPTVQALVSPLTTTTSTTSKKLSTETQRRHTVATVPKKKVQLHLPSRLPLDETQQPVDHAAPPADTKSHLGKSTDSTLPSMAPSDHTGHTSLPAHLLSSGISPALAQDSDDDNDKSNHDHSESTTTSTTTPAPAEVMTYRGMLRLQEQQEKQARRATYFGGAIQIPNEIQGLNDVNNKIAPIPACSNTSRTLSVTSLSLSEDDHDDNNSDSDSEDDDDHELVMTNSRDNKVSKSTFASLSRSVNHLDHVKLSDTFQTTLAMNKPPTKTITTNDAMSAEADVTKPIATIEAPKSTASTTTTNEPIMIVLDHSERGSDNNNASEMFDFGASMSSIVDCGGAYFEDHRVGTEFHPSYEQQRRISMARERARAKKDHEQSGHAVQTGVSVKDRMAAFLTAK